MAGLLLFFGADFVFAGGSNPSAAQTLVTEIGGIVLVVGLAMTLFAAAEFALMRSLRRREIE